MIRSVTVYHRLLARTYSESERCSASCFALCCMLLLHLSFNTLGASYKYRLYNGKYTCLMLEVTVLYKYRLDAEAKGSTVFRIPEDVYKTRGR